NSAGRAALGRAAGAEPEADVRDLGNPRHAHQQVKDRMVSSEIDDGIRLRGQRLAELSLPRLPGVLSPEVVSPEESSLEEIVAKRRGFRLVEIRPARLGHHDERASEQFGLAKPD